MTKVFIPGKLFLAGEYAITHPGNTAIVAATTTGLSVEIAPSTTKSSANSNTLPKQWHFQINHTENQYTDDWRYVRAAIKIIHDYVKIDATNNQLSEVIITITSNLSGPFGKIGLGSSAAVVVGVVEAFNDFFQLNLSSLTRFKLASLAHLHVQQNGSLGDIAAITYGGVIAYQSPDLSEFTQTDMSWLNPTIINKPWPKLAITSLPWPKDWQLLLGATHESADTKSAIKNINLAQEFLSESQYIVQNIINTIITGNYVNFSKGLRDNQLLLTHNLPAGYITPKLAILLESLKNVAGKISGAGFGDNGFAVFNGNVDHLIHFWQLHQIDTQVIVISPQKEVSYE
ncbi:phosphomevalonate kinase [Leuconostoc gelidum subsp. aenigmaticum]|uniref:phosphomevalonate kinase n=1 Tax=Leuconostoc gelidum TaxID=1244 RepID=UPI001CC42B45|nr:phosphomevalonate kinase [Leuconostoc gelidum]MBZ6008076.1 phosphomevalonate kinase [Leuconostoc gelidum subsp. aenigmaticum]